MFGRRDGGALGLGLVLIRAFGDALAPRGSEEDASGVDDGSAFWLQ